MDEYKKNLKKQAIKGVIWKFFERIYAQIVSFLVMVMLARMLMPEDFGVVAIVSIFVSFGNIFVISGFNTALIQKEDADELDHSTIFWFSLVVGIFLYLAIYLFAPQIALFYKNPILCNVLRVMAVLMIINGIKSVYTAYIVRKLEFNKVFVATSVGVTFSAVLGLGSACLNYGVWALVIQQLSNAIFDIISLIYLSKFHLQIKFSLERFKSLFNYGWKIFAASILSVAYDEINPLIIGTKYTGVDLAFFQNGRRLPVVVNSSICETLSSVLFPVLAKLQSDKEKVLNATRRYMKTTSFIVFPVMAGMFAISENFVRVVLTDKWLEAVPYMQLFCFCYMLDVIAKGNLETIKAIGCSDVILKMEIAKKISYFLIIALFVYFATTPLQLAFSAVPCIMVGILVNVYPNRYLIEYKYRYQLFDLLNNYIDSVLMCAVVIFVGFLPGKPLYILIMQIIVGMLIYPLLAYMTKNENLGYAIDILKQVRGKKS